MCAIAEDFVISYHVRMTDFGGWELPVEYDDMGIIAEHRHRLKRASSISGKNN